MTELRQSGKALSAKPLITDMPQYIHYFDLTIRKQFRSERSNFESALSEHLAAFPGDKELREHLLDADESTQDLVDAISFAQTDSLD